MKSRESLLVILGMHRSGTSFLASSMQALGYTLPQDRSDPSPDNPHGHFEPRAVVALNDDALSRKGMWWPHIGPVSAEVEKSQMAAALSESFGDARRIVIKDPRLSLLLPLWRPVLEAQGPTAALIALRHPRSTAASLVRRNGMGADMGHLCWIAYTLSALEVTEGMPRGLVLFPDWIDNPGPTLSRIASIAGMDLPDDAARQVTASFDRTALHNNAPAGAPTDNIAVLAEDLFSLLAQHARNGTMPDRQEMDALQSEFGKCSATAREVEAVATDRQHMLQVQITDLFDQKNRLQERIDSASRDNASLQAQLQETVQERHCVVDALQQHVTATEQQRDEAVLLRDQAAAQASETAARLSETAARLNETTAQLDDTVARLNETVAQFEDSRAELSEQIAETEQQLRQSLEQEQASQDLIGELTLCLEQERHTILKPVYRRMHRKGGRILRRILPRPAFDMIKRRLPYPGGIPTRLAYAQIPSAPARKLGLGEIKVGTTEKPDIFVMSIIDWDFRTQRPQHLAARMTRMGHRVFYIEMTPASGPGTLRMIEPDLYVVRLSSRGMRGTQPYSGTVPQNAVRAWLWHFHDFADQAVTSRYAHIVVEHPYWWNFVRHLSPQFQITFDCMDEISGFANTDQSVLDAEASMVAHADRMIVSSQYLHDKYAPQRNVALVRNGTDIAHFLDTPATASVRFTSGRSGVVRIGYVGAIAEWFDTDLVETMARENPDFDIHLCGSVTAQDPARLDRIGNISMHGEIPYADVPGFLQAMDVLIIPFRLLPIIKACDPVKFYEYSAIGKPTIATALPELERAGNLVTIAHDATGFAAAIRAAVKRAGDPHRKAALQDYARRNDWSFRATAMLAEMERAPLLSVIILAHGPAELTLNCLHSLIGRGAAYPAMEILIVDNGSAPDELERLRDAARHPSIRLIENGENLGFARGNNIGIRAAKGEYVLLLNNDTYVASGAFQAMVSHLSRNPDIGIVGPLTNNIGNEARIETAYANIAGMEKAARQLVTAYRGMWTEIPVCAYFCAMFRKADLDRIGHLPTDYGRGMFEDDDHCASFRAAGLKMALAEDAFVHHELSASFGALPANERHALFDKNRRIFEAKWGKWKPHRYRETRPESNLPGMS